MTDLDQIRQKIDITNLIGQYTVLKKAGRNFKALCPFHSENTPSFVVSAERQIWHCFGACNTGGDIFTFLMKVENLEFPEALEILAKKAGVTLQNQYRVTEKQKLRETLINANLSASNFYHYLLTQHKIGKKVLQYLSDRKISSKIVETFKLGYAPQSWDTLVSYLKKKGFRDGFLAKSGLATLTTRGKLIDRFRGRLMFTIRNHRGQTVGFSGRKLIESVQNDAEGKYVNTAQTEVFTKGDVLYGLDVTADYIRKAQEAIIVEGEFDLLSSFQAGTTNVVAIKGTALTINQAALIKRFAETITFALDADIAGSNAVMRGIEIAENAGLNIKVIATVSGKDPDQTIRENPKNWKEAVAKKVSFYDYLLNSSLSKYDKNDAYGKKKIADEILPFYSRITNPIVQSHYITLLAKSINIAVASINETMNKIIKKTSLGVNTVVMKKEGKNRTEMLEEHFLALILQTSNMELSRELLSAEITKETAKLIVNPAIQKLVLLFGEFIHANQNNKDISLFIKSLPEELIHQADRAYLTQIHQTISDPLIYKKELIDTKNALVGESIRMEMKLLTTKMEESKNPEIIEKLNQQVNLLKNKLKTNSLGS